MGANLVAQVLAHWTHVSDRAFRVLVRMAVTALDKEMNGNPPNIYHAGRELLAMSLRSDKGTADTRYRAVKRAVAELTEAGAIEHLATGWAGQNAVYRLTLQRTKTISAKDPEIPEMGGPTSPPLGGPTSPPMGGLCTLTRGAPEAPPRSSEELQEELAEEKHGSSETASHPPRAKPTPDRCPTHTFVRLKPRTDGIEPCAMCRQEQRPPGLDPPPPRCGHGMPVIDGRSTCSTCRPLAPVINLRTREIS